MQVSHAGCRGLRAWDTRAGEEGVSERRMALCERGLVEVDWLAFGGGARIQSQKKPSFQRFLFSTFSESAVLRDSERRRHSSAAVEKELQREQERQLTMTTALDHTQQGDPTCGESAVRMGWSCW